MKKKILVLLLVLSLVGAFCGNAPGQVLGYSLHKSDKGFREPPAASPAPSRWLLTV